MLGGDDVREKGLPKDRLGVSKIRLPERVPLRGHRIFAGNAVDQNIESTVLAIDLTKEGLDL